MKRSFLILVLISATLLVSLFSKAMSFQQYTDPKLVTKALVEEAEGKTLEQSIKIAIDEVIKEARKQLPAICGAQAASMSNVEVRILKTHLEANGNDIPYNYVTLETVYFCADSSKKM